APRAASLTTWRRVIPLCPTFRFLVMTITSRWRTRFEPDFDRRCVAGPCLLATVLATPTINNQLVHSGAKQGSESRRQALCRPCAATLSSHSSPPPAPPP